MQILFQWKLINPRDTLQVPADLACHPGKPLNNRLQRGEDLPLVRTWDQRVTQWHSHVTSAPAFDEIRAQLIAMSAPERTDDCVDLGAGTGFVTTALAPLVHSVLAVDISPEMTRSLAEQADLADLGNVRAEVGDLNELSLNPESTDLIVSNYALHHLTDSGKRALVANTARWLRPGGRLVLADMMFGRGTTPRDRRILREKVAALAAKGPGGWWRIARNLTRYGFRTGHEHPASPEFWQEALRDEGFTDVIFEPVVAEAGIVRGTRPA